jgi:carbon-monoxide dehydrogenase medium subunit
VITTARVALGAVGPTPIFAETAGASLKGKEPSDVVFAEAARLAQEAARPITDMRGTEAQRRHLVGVLTRRALRGAWERAKGGKSNGR